MTTRSEYIPNAPRHRIPVPAGRRGARLDRLVPSPGHVYPAAGDDGAGPSGVHGGDCGGAAGGEEMYEEAMARVGRPHDGVLVARAFLRFLLEDGS